VAHSLCVTRPLSVHGPPTYVLFFGLLLLPFFFSFLFLCSLPQIIENFVGRCLYHGKMLGSRDTETFLNNKAKNQLHTIDYVYLFINSFIEMIFMFQLVHLAINNSNIAYGWHWNLTGVADDAVAEQVASPTGNTTGLNVYNTLVASIFLILFDDAVYAPAHRLMHWKPLYPLIHKHHHRQKFPERGYVDAGNEHPLEQVIGLSIIYYSIVLTAHLFGMHIGALVLTFIFYAFVNVVNHTSYDIKMHYLGVGFEFAVGAHEMHHRFFDCNYAKSCMWFDILMGTYEPYSKQRRPKKHR